MRLHSALLSFSFIVAPIGTVQPAHFSASLPAESSSISAATPIAEPAPAVPAPINVYVPQSDWRKVENISAIADADARKAAFAGLILPAIRAVNDEISTERLRLIEYRRLRVTAHGLNVSQTAWLSDISTRYKTEDGDINELLKRVNVIPERLALAQAALESGWGTSDLAKDSLSFFGETDGNGTYVGFSSIVDCVRAYAVNLNTHRAYTAFRDARASGQKPADAYAIAVHLTKYSELGDKYVGKVRHVMKFSDQFALQLLSEVRR